MARFTPRVRKQKALRRIADDSHSQQEESEHANAETIIPEEQRLHRAKRDALKAELKAGQPKFSAKKQKRLEKYIDNKLKKEENLELLKKLAATSTDTAHLRSSRSLGAGRKRHEPSAILTSAAEDISDWEGFSDTASTSESDRALQSQPKETQVKPAKSPVGSDERPSSTAAQLPHAAFGAGLKRPANQDSQGQPVIQKRQRVNKRMAPDRREELLSLLEQTMSSSGSDAESDTSDMNSEDESDDSDDSEDSLGSTDTENEPGKANLSMFALPKANDPTLNRNSGVREILEGWSKQASGYESHLSNIEALKQLPASLRAKQAAVVGTARDTEPLPAELQTSAGNQSRTAFHVRIERSPSIQETRLKLPVIAEEQKIMEAIHNNSVTIICGETGSGKTTQIPQLIFETGYGAPESTTPGMIGITQPRRVAAITMAQRVSEEMGDHSDNVAYATRFQNTVKQSTRVKYMTDGILLKEVAADIALKKYSAIVIDEAHERSVNTDTLIGLLSRAVELRETMSSEDSKVSPLKLVIMSATLAAGDLVTNQRLFRKRTPPLIEIEGRQYPVTVHFARRTQEDYLEQAFKKIVNGHRKLPPGSILVFLTGQAEITYLSSRLKEAFGVRSSSAKPTRDDDKFERQHERKVHLTDEDADDYDNQSGDDESGLSRTSELEDEDPNGEAEHEGFDIEEEASPLLKAKILPLYAQLPPQEQLRVFEQPAEGTRVIILATNVAETSITIPNIRYVIDCGRAKVKRIDPHTGVQSLVTDWISKASASQRLGRAGRTGPGHCYRLYSSPMYESQFIEHAQPEITSVPIEDVVLLLKKMRIPGSIASFPFPTPPDTDSVAKAETLLCNLGALDLSRSITNIGENMSNYPVSPRLARMMLVGQQNGLVRVTAALVAALAIPELYISEGQLGLSERVQDNGAEIFDQAQRLEEDAREVRRRAYARTQAQLAKLAASSDALKLLQGFRKYLQATNTPEALSISAMRHGSKTSPAVEAECAKWYLRPRACAEARSLFLQLLRQLADRDPATGIDTSGKPPESPAASDLVKLKQIVAAGFIDQVAIRLDLLDDSERLRLEKLHPAYQEGNSKKIHARTATEVGYVPLYGGDTLAFVHPSSILARINKTEMPPFLVYERLQARPTHKSGIARTSIYPYVSATANLLRDLARGLPILDWGKPIGKVEVLDGRRRRVWVIPSLVNAGERDAKRRRWPLPPAVQVIQKRDKRGEWAEDV